MKLNYLWLVLFVVRRTAGDYADDPGEGWEHSHPQHPQQGLEYFKCFGQTHVHKSYSEECFCQQLPEQPQLHPQQQQQQGQHGGFPARGSSNKEDSRPLHAPQAKLCCNDAECVREHDAREMGDAVEMAAYRAQDEHESRAREGSNREAREHEAREREAREREEEDRELEKRIGRKINNGEARTYGEQLWYEQRVALQRAGNFPDGGRGHSKEEQEAPVVSEAASSRGQAHYHPQAARAPPRPTPRTPRPTSPVKRHSDVRDYYAVLHLAPGAPLSEIKQAYHRMALAWHPDRNRQPGQEERLTKAERNFKLVARAYEVLSDEGTRQAFDRGENVDDPMWQRRRGK